MEMLHAPVSTALVGLGDVAEQHKRAMDLCGHTQLVGVWTRNPEKGRRLAGQWNVRAYPDYDTLLADDAVQVVDITAADAVHYEFALRALEAGKHVIVEKPPAESSAQVCEMRAAAQTADLHCIPMHNCVYPSPDSTKPS